MGSRIFLLLRHKSLDTATYIVLSIILSFLYFAFLPQIIKADAFIFTSAGDFSTGSGAQAVAAAMDNGSNFSLGLGDYTYGGSASTFCGFFPAGYAFEHVAGNHDTGESDPNIMPTLVSCLPHRAGSAATGSYGHHYYFDYPATSPQIRVIMVRPGVRGTGDIGTYNTGSAQFNDVSNWIDSARAAGIKWIAVGMHKNYISAMTKGNELGTSFIPMLLSKKVDLILQGHEHGYERTKQLTCATTGSFNASCVVDSDDTFSKGAGSVIVVLGTGGQGWRGHNTGDSEFQYFAKVEGNGSQFGFGKFDITATGLTYTYVRTAGSTLTDSFVITDCATCPTSPPPTVGPSPTPTRTPTPAPGVDLVVTDVSWSPATPNNGSAVTFSATIKNNGLGATPNGVIHGVRFHVDGTPLTWSDTHTSSIPAGGSVTLTANGSPTGSATWTATSGTHQIMAFVDDVNRITETDEANNQRTESLTVGTGTTTATPTGSCPTLPTDKGTATASVNITTAGTYTIWSRMMAADSANNSYFLQIDNQCGINVGDSSTLSTSTWTWLKYKDGNTGSSITANLTAGTHVIKMIGREDGVKLDKIVLLTDAACIPTGFGDNCTITATATPTNTPPTPTPVVAPPTNTPVPTSGTGSVDLLVTNVSWTPASPIVGDTVTFKATIKNQGTAASPNGVIHGVRFSVDGTLWSWSDNHTTSIPAGGSVTVTANGGPVGIGSTWTATSGTHTITAWFDDQNRIAETNETNNTLNGTLIVGAATSTPTPTRTPTPIVPTNTPAPTSTPMPTATPVPNSTRFNMNILLHGIGRGGDNANPGSIGNNTPLHPQKTLNLELYDGNNTLVKTVSGTVTFNSTNGNFTGIFDGGTGIASGPYLVKVKGIPYLRKQVGGIISVTSGQTSSLPQAALTVGDANNDNNLNILDYNLMLDCYSELSPPRNCDPQKLLTTDFNDDGAVNQFDYNLFLRELSIQVGQ